MFFDPSFQIRAIGAHAARGSQLRLEGLDSLQKFSFPFPSFGSQLGQLLTPVTTEVAWAWTETTSWVAWTWDAAIALEASTRMCCSLACECITSAAACWITSAFGASWYVRCWLCCCTLGCSAWSLSGASFTFLFRRTEAEADYSYWWFPFGNCVITNRTCRRRSWKVIFNHHGTPKTSPPKAEEDDKLRELEGHHER